MNNRPIEIDSSIISQLHKTAEVINILMSEARCQTEYPRNHSRFSDTVLDRKVLVSISATPKETFLKLICKDLR